MGRTNRSVALLAVLTLGGCGGPTLDATSEETLKASADKVMAALDEAKKEKFQEAMVVLTTKHVIFAGGDEAATKKAMHDAFDGKTADQIIADGAKAKADGAESMKN